MGWREQAPVQHIQVDIEDFKSVLLEQTGLILAMIEKIIEHGEDIPEEIRVLATTIGGNLGLHMITDAMTAEAIAYSGPNYGSPELVTIWVDEGRSNFEEALIIANSGDVSPDDLDPPKAGGFAEGLEENEIPSVPAPARTA